MQFEDGLLYVVDEVSDELATVQISPLLKTVIGVIRVGSTMGPVLDIVGGDLTINSSGTWYLFTNSNSKLYSLDVTTAVATEIGPATWVDGRINGLAVDYGNADTLYASSRDTDKLLTLNPATGAVTASVDICLTCPTAYDVRAGDLGIPQPTATPTETPSETPTETPTASATATASDSPSSTATATVTETATATATASDSPSSTATATMTETATATATASDSPSSTATATVTQTATATATASDTPSPATSDAPPPRARRRPAPRQLHFDDDGDRDGVQQSELHRDGYVDADCDADRDGVQQPELHRDGQTATRRPQRDGQQVRRRRRRRGPIRRSARSEIPAIAPAECASMNCVDGVCCDSPCDEPGEQCDLPGREGECLRYRPAPAPTLNWPALAAALAVMIGAAGVALRRRRSP